MNLLLVSSRTLSMLVVGYTGLPAAATYAVCYFLFVAGFVILFVKWLKFVFLRGLAVFKNNLTIFVIFAAVCYFGTIALVDIWEAWPALTIVTALPNISVIAINLAGYVLAFHALATLSERLIAETETKMARFQLGLAEKEYKTTMEGIDHVRRARHDMNHNLSAIAALIANDRKAEALKYIEKMGSLVPKRRIFNENFITNSFVDHYSELCATAKIDFSAQINYSEEFLPNKVHLGILLGNSLQNAFEAADKAAPERKFISIEGRQVHSNLILVVKNGFEGELGEELKSTKGEGRGIGLGSMRSVVEGYNGYLNTEAVNGVFTLKIMLVLQNKSTN